MQTSFTDLVGTAAFSTHCLEGDELTDLTPSLDTERAVNELTAQASEAGPTLREWGTRCQ